MTSIMVQVGVPPTLTLSTVDSVRSIDERTPSQDNCQNLLKALYSPDGIVFL